MAETERSDKAGNKPPHSPLTVIIEVKNLNFFYGNNRTLFHINLQIYKNKITTIIGPSGCGKSTLLRCFNRLNDLIKNARVEGHILIGTKNIYDKDVDPIRLRRLVGMVFQQPNPFPKSIFDNVAYGPRMHGVKNKKKLQELVEVSLKRAALWQEVKHRLHAGALSLSGGQQQRLCIARAIAIKPEIILMDEPAASLDPIATSSIEDLIFELKENYTVIMVTHNMQQAARVGDYTAFLLNGELVEYDETTKIFHKPAHKKTLAYIQGHFG